MFDEKSYGNYFVLLLHFIKYPPGRFAPVASVHVSGIVELVVVPQANDVGKLLGSKLMVVKVLFVP